jgi:hypothetical protein
MLSRYKVDLLYTLGYKCLMENKEKSAKKLTCLRLDPALVKEIKFLSVEQDRTVTSLFEEAAKDLLQKYKAK